MKFSKAKRLKIFRQVGTKSDFQRSIFYLWHCRDTVRNKLFLQGRMSLLMKIVKKIQWPGPQITPNKTEKALDDWIGGSTHFQLMAAWPNFVIVFVTSLCDADNSFNLISPPPLIITQFKTIHFPWKKQHPFLYLQAVSTVRYTGTIVTAFVWSHRSSVLSVMYTMCEKTVAET